MRYVNTNATNISTYAIPWSMDVPEKWTMQHQQVFFFLDFFKKELCSAQKCNCHAPNVDVQSSNLRTSSSKNKRAFFFFFKIIVHTNVGYLETTKFLLFSLKTPQVLKPDLTNPQILSLGSLLIYIAVLANSTTLFKIFNSDLENL